MQLTSFQNKELFCGRITASIFVADREQIDRGNSEKSVGVFSDRRELISEMTHFMTETLLFCSRS